MARRFSSNAGASNEQSVNCSCSRDLLCVSRHKRNQVTYVRIMVCVCVRACFLCRMRLAGHEAHVQDMKHTYVLIDCL